MTEKLRIYAGIFLLSLALLLFELALIRVFSATLFYHFAFMALSVAMLGLAAAGLTVHLAPGRFPSDQVDRWSGWAAALFAISLVASLWIVFRIPVNAYLPPNQIGVKLTVIYLLSAVPFYFAGLVFSGLFASFPRQAGSLYAWDLVGAGVGSLLILPLMYLVGGESIGFYIMALGLASAAFFAGKRWKLMAGLAVVAVILGLTNPSAGWLQIQYSKGLSLKSLDIRYNRWNSFSRIMAIPFKPGTDAAYTWCPSPKYPLPKMEHLSLMIDDGAATPVLPFDGKNLAPIDYLKNDLTSLSHRLRGNGNTLVIGCGGGRDVLTGLMYDARHIDAVDVNPLIFDAMNHALADFNGYLYLHEKVDWYASEGRAFARRHPGEYDLVQIAMIDTWASTVAGAYALSENTLYTVEAFQDYFHALKPGGMLSFTRFFFRPPRQALRLVSLYLEAAKREGIQHPEQCVLVGMYESLATLVFKTEPFTAEEIAQFKADLNDLGFNLIYAPDEKIDPFFRVLIDNPDKQWFYDRYTYNVQPTTDDKPFFFNMLKMKDIMKVFDLQEGQKFNYYATYTLIMVLVLSLIATLVTLILPVAFKRKDGQSSSFPGRGWLLGYFIAIGLAYLMIESALIQRFMLLLEHPAYAASGVVAGMLISSGLGSMYWGKQDLSRRKQLLPIVFGAVFVGLLIHIILGMPLIQAVIQLPLIVKALIAAVMVVPLGFFMGMPLPAGITVAGNSGANTVAWCWALNGAASVVASSLAVALAMGQGFSVVLMVSLAAYVAAFGSMLILSKDSTRLA